MRIAIFHDLPSGGAKRTLFETVKRLSLQHSLDVYTLSTSDKEFCSLSKYVEAEHIYPFLPTKLLQSPFGRVNQLLRWVDLRRLNELSRQIATDIDGRQYDVVFAQPCMWTQAPLILRYLRTPTVYYCHEPPRQLYEKLKVGNPTSSLRRFLSHFDPLIWLYQTTGRHYDIAATRAAKLVLTNSRFTREQIQKIYGVRALISYHGVDADVFAPQDQLTKDPYVLSVGAIHPHKGFDFLIESLSLIDEEYRPPLHLVGNMQNAEDFEKLQELARSKSVNLSIEVGVDQETLTQKYNKTMLLVYAPYNEPFGLVPLEAMACGVAVVGVDEGGVKETVVNGFTGILVERDTAKFAEAIQTLLTNPSRLSELGQNGRKYVLQNWSWEKAVERLELYLRL